MEDMKAAGIDIEEAPAVVEEARLADGAFGGLEWGAQKLENHFAERVPRWSEFQDVCQHCARTHSCSSPSCIARAKHSIGEGSECFTDHADSWIVEMWFCSWNIHYRTKHPWRLELLLRFQGKKIDSTARCMLQNTVGQSLCNSWRDRHAELTAWHHTRCWKATN